MKRLAKARTKGRGRVPLAADEGPRAGGLEDRLWRELAGAVAASGLSPSLAALAARLDLGWGQIRTALFRLAKKGLIRIEGRAPHAVYHLERWPDGVKPRETRGRADGPVSMADVAKREAKRARPPGPNDSLFRKPPRKPDAAAANGEPVPADVTRRSFGV